MDRRTTMVLAWTLGAVVAVGAAIGFIISLSHSQVTDNLFAIADQLLTGIYTAASGIVGALILARQPRNKIGWLLMAIGLFLSIGGGIQEYLGQHILTAPNLDWAAYVYIWMSAWTWWLLIGPLLLMLLVFPTGHLLSRRWRWVAGMVGLLFVTFLVIATAMPMWDVPDIGQQVPNPLGQIPLDISFDTILIPWEITLFSTAALCVISVLVRYRRAGIVEREQLKWFFYACAVFLLVYSTGFFNTGDQKNIFAVFFGLAILFIPVSIGIAILRYRLFDIDVIIRRTIIYGALTLSLALVYLGGVVVMQQVLRAVSGQTSDLAIVASTLVIAALFAPLRHWIQNIVDRRLYRRKYDAARVLEAFGVTLRNKVDLPRLEQELITVVHETMQPAHATLLLKKVDSRVSGGKS